jgi:hypothetical protein
VQRDLGWYGCGVQRAPDVPDGAEELAAVASRAHSSSMNLAWSRRSVWLCRILFVIVLALVGTWVVERTTWYLAIDQFGYLTFARDLAAGKVFHSWDAERFLGPLLPRNLAADVLAQTYIRRGDLLHCRYAPGFPLLLAAFAPLGESALRSVNLVALLGMLGCLYGVGRRLLGSEWAGLCVAILACLLPTYLLLWSISPLRDVPTHLFAFGALWLLASAAAPPTRLRAAAAGALLGYAISMRADAALYLVPVACIAWLVRPWARRTIVMGVGGLLLGLLPVLTYNTITNGNPFRSTQFMEVQQIMSSTSGDAPARDADPWLDWLPVWTDVAHAAEISPQDVPMTQERLLQGGGLKLRHLRVILPENIATLRGVFGDLGLALVAVGAIAAVRRPMLLAFAVPYVVVATLFFSLWTRADPRYLAGVVLMGTLLVVEGVAALVTLAGTSRRGVALAVGVVIAGGTFWMGSVPEALSGTALPAATLALQGAIVAGLIAAVACGRSAGRGTALAVLGVALAGILFWRSGQNLGFRARFQRAEAERARSTIESLLEEPALVVTRSDIGRPAENINYYTDIDAIYEQEMVRWGVEPIAVVNAAVRQGVAAYLLMTPDAVDRWLTSPRVRKWFLPEIVAQIPASRAADVFVASPDHRGVPLQLVRIRLRPEFAS